jgi:HNH endonuclease
MPVLRYMTVCDAFNRIGATREDGSPYSRVQGISVSHSGIHFCFEQKDIKYKDDRTLELYRAPRGPGNPRPWLSTVKGQKFFGRLVEAKESGASIFCVISRKKKDAYGKETDKSDGAAPVLTESGAPAPGRVMVADSKSGEVHVVISLFAKETSTSKFIDQFDLTLIESIVTRTSRQTTSYSRDPEVRAKVLQRAAAICERPQCRKPGFQTSHGIYLETHHVIPLSDNGRDATDNVVALCANCHRMAHYSLERETIRNELIALLR